MPHATAFLATDTRGRLPRHELAAMSYLAGFNGATLRNYSSLLKTFFEWSAQHELDPLAATRAHLELYVRHLENERRNHPSTIGNKIGVLKGFYDFAAEDGYIDKNPARRVRAPRYFYDENRLVGLERTEIMQMLHTARRESASDDALVTLMVILGLRVSEAIAVRIEDYGEEDRSHRVLRVVGKGHKAASMPLPAAALRSLDRAKGDRRAGPLIVRESNGEPHTAVSARRRIRRLGKIAGITKDVRPHLLRHSMVTSALDAGGDIRDVQVHARHSDPRTTMRYDRARKNLDRHTAYLVAGYLTGGSA